MHISQVFLIALFLSSGCKMNVHIRCKGNVAPNCGVNSVELANRLAEMGLQAGGLTKRSPMVQIFLNQMSIEFT